MADIIIPLKQDPSSQYLQLKLALRSIQRYAHNLGDIYVCTPAGVPWLRNANSVQCADDSTKCKDFNILNKLKTAAQHCNDSIIFWSDDQLLTAQLDLNEAPVVRNRRSLQYLKQGKLTKWRKALISTMQMFPSLEYNYQSHVPQPYNKQLLLQLQAPEVFTVNTLYYGTHNIKSTVNQGDVKVTLQKGSAKLPQELKLYLGHDEASWKAGVKQILFQMFPQKSRYQI